MMAELFEGFIRRAIVWVRKQGEFDSADAAENFIAEWKSGRIYEPRSNPEVLGPFNREVERLLHIDSTGTRARLRFQPERAWHIKLGDDRVTVEDVAASATWELRLTQSLAAGESPAVIVTSKAFPDRDAAERALSRLEHALLVTSLQSGYGFSFSERVPPTVITEHGLKAFVPETVRALQDDLGEVIFETPPPTLFLHVGRPSLTVGVNPSIFLDRLNAALQAAQQVEDRTRTAYELFASSRFENSSRARFLLLVMAVEAMLDRENRPQTQIDFLVPIVEQVQAMSKSDAAWTLLANGLGELKRESIASAAARQITAVVSAEAASDFKKAYGLRSRLVHGGKRAEPGELNDTSNKLEPTVKALLLWRLTTAQAVAD
jgi:hypothetical protein